MLYEYISNFIEGHPFIAGILALFLLAFIGRVWRYILEHTWAFYVFCAVMLVVFWPFFVLLLILKIWLWVDAYIIHDGVIQKKIIENAIRRNKD